MKFLLDHGTDVNIRNEEGKRPIDAPVARMCEALKRWVSLMDLMKVIVWMRIRLSKMKRNK